MPQFAFRITGGDGATSYEEHDFALRSEAIALAHSKLGSAALVSVGLIGADIEWFGRWTNEAMDRAWEPAE